VVAVSGGGVLAGPLVLDVGLWVVVTVTGGRGGAASMG
jgi:hypothetical protein